VIEVFNYVCSDLGVPLCPDKLIGLFKTITYLGLEINAGNQTIHVPAEKNK
jgi:hypothetical protein